MFVAARGIKALLIGLLLLLVLIIVLIVTFQLIILLLPIFIIIFLLGYFFRMLSKLGGRTKPKKNYVDVKYKVKK